jgi:hypothetical protein
MEVLQDYSTPCNNGTLPYIFNRLHDTRRRRPTPAARTKRGRKRGIVNCLASNPHAAAGVAQFEEEAVRAQWRRDFLAGFGRAAPGGALAAELFKAAGQRLLKP